MCLISLNTPAAQSVKNQRTFAVIRFKRDTKFPRFAVSAGERWSFLAVNKTQERLDQIKRGERCVTRRMWKSSTKGPAVFPTRWQLAT